MPGLVGVLTVFGMVVVTPVGLRLLGTPGLARLARIWPAPALLAGLSLLLPRGALAVALALPYAAACALAAGLAAVRGLRWLRARRTPLLPEMAAAMAGASLAVAASGLVPERAGVTFLGYSLPILGLTAAHFHYAGFAAVVLAGLAARRVPGPVAAAAAWAVPAGTLVTLVGFFTGNAVELAGATVLTAGLLVTSYVLLARVVPGVADRRARALLVAAALAAPASMALAMWWAAGEAFGFGHPTLRQMAATHGVVNALGVATCGLLGWRRVAPPPL